MSEHRTGETGKILLRANESPPKRGDDDVKDSIIQRHVDYVDLAERVVQGITVRQDLDPEEVGPSSPLRDPVRKRPGRHLAD
jgi:hypothetical protein